MALSLSEVRRRKLRTVRESRPSPSVLLSLEFPPSSEFSVFSGGMVDSFMDVLSLFCLAGHFFSVMAYRGVLGLGRLPCSSDPQWKFSLSYRWGKLEIEAANLADIRERLC